MLAYLTHNAFSITRSDNTLTVSGKEAGLGETATSSRSAARR
jgi:hypothetical protein